MSIVLNECKQAEDILKEKDLGKHPTEALSVVAKYYFYNGMNKRDVRSSVESFLLECDPFANLVTWSDSLDRIIKYSERHKLTMIDNIPVSKTELDLISTLKGVQTRRLAFTLLCLSKYYYKLSENNDHWVNTPDGEIMRMANIHTSIKRQSAMYRELRDKGLIRFSKMVDNLNVQVLFADDSGCELRITDFRNLGYQYLKYIGEPYYVCTNCGITTKLNNSAYGSRTKYCPDCAIKIRMQQNVNSVMRKRRAVGADAKDCAEIRA